MQADVIRPQRVQLPRDPDGKSPSTSVTGSEKLFQISRKLIGAAPESCQLVRNSRVTPTQIRRSQLECERGDPGFRLPQQCIDRLGLPAICPIMRQRVRRGLPVKIFRGGCPIVSAARVIARRALR